MAAGVARVGIGSMGTGMGEHDGDTGEALRALGTALAAWDAASARSGGARPADGAPVPAVTGPGNGDALRDLVAAARAACATGYGHIPTGVPQAELDALADAARARDAALEAAFAGDDVELFRVGRHRVFLDAESHDLLARAAQNAFVLFRLGGGDARALAKEAYEAVSVALDRLTYAEIRMGIGKRDAAA